MDGTVRRFFLLISFVIFLGPRLAWAQREDAAEALLDALYKKYVGERRYRVDFSYEMASPLHSIKETLVGNAVVEGEKYVIYLDTTQLIHDGKSTWNFSLDNNEVIITNETDVDNLMSIRNLMGMYQQDFKYRLLSDSAKGGVSVVELVPEDRDKEFFKVQLLVRAAEKKIEQFILFFKDGQRYTLSLGVMEPLRAARDDFFTFKPQEHKGVEIIDLR